MVPRIVLTHATAGRDVLHPLDLCACSTQGTLGLLLSLAGALVSQAATITVGPGQSIASAISSMHGGDTLVIQAGTYREGNLTPPSGASGAPTIIKAAPGAQVILQPNTTVFDFQSGRHGIVIDSLVLDGNMQTAYPIYEAPDVSNITFQNSGSRTCWLRIVLRALSQAVREPSSRRSSARAPGFPSPSPGPGPVSAPPAPRPTPRRTRPPVGDGRGPRRPPLQEACWPRPPWAVPPAASAGGPGRHRGAAPRPGVPSGAGQGWRRRAWGHTTWKVIALKEANGEDP